MNKWIQTEEPQKNEEEINENLKYKNKFIILFILFILFKKRWLYILILKGL